MAKIQFKVSARTARLIGRENVANAEGAVIELVKNCYDADAFNCIVFFDNKYHLAPLTLTREEYLILNGLSNLIDLFYIQDTNGNYLLNNDSNKDVEELNSFFFSFCHLYIIDNGCGMTEKIIRDSWMTIGTDNKNVEYKTKMGRIKTGEKGIGRFALDRLGRNCEIYTLPEEEEDGFLWRVNWSDFEKPGLTIDKVEADLTRIENLNLKMKIRELTQDYMPLSKAIDKIYFKSGTVIKIDNLADDWDEHLVNKIFRSLEILVPPKEVPTYSICLFSSLQDNKYGEVLSEYCDDFDYKVSARHLDDKSKTLILNIERNELDINLIEKEYMDVFKQERMKRFPYDFDTLKEKKFTIETTLNKLVPGFNDNDTKHTLDQIGEFSFTFYFLKNVITSDEKEYPYKPIFSASRKQWLDKFGGVKIFRDGFVVRPYGDYKNDWLGLGERAAKSPGGAGQKRTGYRIRPNQIAGSIHISRITNENLQDKSGREGIQENEAFSLFKNIIIGIIKEFEEDRNYVMYSFKQLTLERDEYEKTKQKAEAITNDRLKQKSIREINRRLSPGPESKSYTDTSIASSSKTNSKSYENLESDVETLAEIYNMQKQELKEKEDELHLIRSLASSGLIVATFAHELEQIVNQLETRTFYLKKYLNELLETSKIEKLPSYKNPFLLIDEIEEQDKKFIKWVNFSLITLKKDRRFRKDSDIGDYFNKFSKSWHNFLLDRQIKLDIKEKEEKCFIRAYDIDLDSIFANLVVNSFEAFKGKGSSKNRLIEIDWKRTGKSLIISYKDTGCGLSRDYKDNPEAIFKAFETTKRDRQGNEIGTGLGMWLVKNIVDEYSGKVTILKPEQGFELQIMFPLPK